MFSKKWIKATIVILIITMIVSYGSAYYILYNSSNKINLSNIFNSIVNMDFDYWDDNTYHDSINLNQEENISIDSVELISINLIGEDLNIIPYDKDVVNIKLTGKVTSNFLNNSPELIVVKENSSLKIQVKSESKFDFGVNKINLDVYIPKAYNKNLSVSSVSSDMKISSMNFNDIGLNTTSGDVELNNIDSNEITCESVSGDIYGNLVNCTDIRFKTTSGQCKIENFTGNISGKSVSGDFSVNYLKFNNNINFDTTSGDLSISLPNDAAFKYNYSTVSGKLTGNLSTHSNNKNTDINGTIGTNPSGAISLSSISGDIKVETE